VQELFADMAEPYDITIEEMEVSLDHIHNIEKVGRRLAEEKNVKTHQTVCFYQKQHNFVSGLR
jgi:REP element-mobilizing transposase RayT